MDSPSLFNTPTTGTITVGGGDRALACCEGGIVVQYSLGLLGLGLRPVRLEISAKKNQAKKLVSKAISNDDSKK